MEKDRYEKLDIGTIYRVFDKHGGLKGAMLFLTDEKMVVDRPHRWVEHPTGEITFTVLSDGMNGEGWIEKLQEKKYQIGGTARSILLSKEFVPTSAILTKVVVIRSKCLPGQEYTTGSIFAEQSKRGWLKPSAEVACLSRLAFTDNDLESLGLTHINFMHEPVRVENSNMCFFNINRNNGGRYLRTSAHYGENDGWGTCHAFAFAEEIAPVSLPVE